MSLPPDLLPVAEAFLRAGRALDTTEISKALPRLSSHQKALDELADQHWLVPAPHSQQRWLLNLDHPGADALLELLEITDALDPTPYRAHFQADVAQPFYSFPPGQDGPAGLKELFEDADRIALPERDQTELLLLGQLVRAERRNVARILADVTDLEAHYQALYSATSNERARDFIHRLIHLNQALLSPEHSLHEDPRRAGIRLAFIADHNSQVLKDYGQMTSMAARLGRERARASEALANYAQEHFLSTGATGAQGIYSESEGQQTAHERQRLTKEIDQASPALIAHGGMPGIQDLGHAGDYLLAHLLLHAGTELTAVVERLRGDLEPSLASLLGQDPDSFVHDRR